MTVELCSVTAALLGEPSSSGRELTPEFSKGIMSELASAPYSTVIVRGQRHCRVTRLR